MSEEVTTYLGALVVRLLGEGEPLADVGDVDEAGRALHEAGVARVRRALGCNSMDIYNLGNSLKITSGTTSVL